MYAPAISAGNRIWEQGSSDMDKNYSRQNSTSNATASVVQPIHSGSCKSLSFGIISSN